MLSRCVSQREWVALGVGGGGGLETPYPPSVSAHLVTRLRKVLNFQMFPYLGWITQKKKKTKIFRKNPLPEHLCCPLALLLRYSLAELVPHGPLHLLLLGRLPPFQKYLFLFSMVVGVGEARKQKLASWGVGLPSR